MGAVSKRITGLDHLVDSLPKESRKLFRRIFSVNTTTGTLVPPETMKDFIEKQFGSVDRVTNQKIVRVTNLVTFEGAIFNSLRALRPRTFEDRLKLEARLIDLTEVDPLDHPLRDTPEDPFGRVKTKHSITASNIAKYDGLHAMIIFDHHNPLWFTREEVVDYLSAGWRWAKKARKFDPEAKYYFFLWNCLKKAGATLAHGHAQVTLSRGSHYAKIEALRQCALRYQAQYGSNYFDDLYQIHYSLGLGFEKERVRVLAYLTPIKEKEVIILSKRFDLSFKERVYEVLACYRDSMHVTAFNLGIATPPLNSVPQDWKHFPVIARLVDRGYPWDGSSDFGTMELYASSVISFDPFSLSSELKKALLKGED